MKNIIYIYYFIFIVVIGIIGSSRVGAQTLNINGITPKASECAADGELAVETSVTNLGVLTVVKVTYAIESDILIANKAEQESVGDPYKITFTDLPPGNHRLIVRVYLSNTEIITQQRPFSIGGSYETPDASIEILIPSMEDRPSCILDTTGVLYVHLESGKAPFTITIAEYTGSSTLVDPVGRNYEYTKKSGIYTNFYFTGLPSGAYKFRIEDACGFVFYKTGTLTTINIYNYLYSTSSWIDVCTLKVKPYIINSSTIPYPSYSDISKYYSNHPNITFKVKSGSYTSVERKINEYDDIPANLTEDLTFSGSYEALDPCGNVVRTFSTGTISNNSSSSNILPPLLSYAGCDSLRVSVDPNRYTQYRILANEDNRLIVDWQNTVSSKSEYMFFLGEPIKNRNGKYYKIEVKNKCGGTYSYTCYVKHPTYHIASHTRILAMSAFNCDKFGCTFNFTARIDNDSDGIICLPAKYNFVKLIDGTNNPDPTAEQIEIECSVRGSNYYKERIPCGRYNVFITGADGYKTSEYTYDIAKPAPTISSIYNDVCNENRAYFRVNNLTKDCRIVIRSSPESVYYDKSFDTNVSTYDVYPNEFAPIDGIIKTGLAGNYSISVYDSCGVEYPIDFTISERYKPSNFEMVKGAETCDGITYTSTGTLTFEGASKTAYVKIIEAPQGYVLPVSNPTIGSSIVLKQSGRYIFGISYTSSIGTCHFTGHTDTVEYDGANVRIDFDRSLAYICPGAADSDGHIYVKARKGKEPYKYYVSPEGTGGEDLLENNISAIIDSTDNGDFTHLSFQKGTSYDITIRDGCGSTAVQKFKIGDLREVRLAYAVNSVVCVGGNIEFKAMGLPNPTYKWYKPDGTFFSDEQYASIPNASLSDGGIYKVEITTSLCTSQTVELEVPVAVQPVPTLTRSGGDASQFVCRYSNMDEIVYTWGGSATDVEVTGITTTYYVKDMLAKTLTIKGTVNSNLSYTIKTLGGCNEVSASGTLTYKLSPTASVSGTRNQSICLGNSITNIVFTNAASTTDITVTGLPAGVTGSYASNRLTISGTPVVAGTFDYVVTSSSSDPTNPCVSTEYPGTITVGTENLLDLTSEEGTDRQTICKATSGYTYLTKPIVYTWGGMATNVTVTGSLSSSTYYTKNTTAKTITFTRVPAGAGTYDFTITTVGACTPKSLSGSVTTLNTATSGSISITGNTTVCKNSSTILTADYTGIINPVYRWYEVASGGTPVSTDNPFNTGALSGNKTYYVSVSGDNYCESTRKAHFITVLDPPVIQALSDQCPNLAVTIVVTNSKRNITYSVYDAPVGGNLKGSAMRTTAPVTAVLNISVGVYATTTTLYVQSSEGVCARVPVTVPVKNLPTVYPDMRLQVCPEASTQVNLNSYFDRREISTITWTNPHGFTLTSGYLLNANLLTPSQTYQFKYTIKNSCNISSTGVLYVRALDNSGMSFYPPDTVTICKDQADYLILNQIMGLNEVSGGTWDFTDLNPTYTDYISIVSGSVIFDGQKAWADNKGTALPGGARKIEIKYNVPANSCNTSTQSKIVFVITPTI